METLYRRILSCQFIKGDNNVVADALSCLHQKSTSCEDSQESFYALVECHEYKNKNTDKDDYHPLSFEQLELAQKLDPQLKKELLSDNREEKVDHLVDGNYVEE